MKINVGSGVNRIEGYHNIDIVPCQGVDEVCDGTQILDRHIQWQGTIEEIVCFHTLEHFTRNQAIQAITQWRQLLKMGGKVIVELPNLEELCKLVAGGDTSEMTLAYIFGPQDRDGQNHLWGWSPNTLRGVFEGVGFSEITIKPAEDYHANERPCFRLEATK